MNRLFPPWRSRRVLHAGADLVVVDKLTGVGCHPQHDRDVDLATRVGRWLEERGEQPAALVTALDREASGVVLLGRSKEGRRAIAEAVEAGLARRWIAAIEGEPRRPWQPSHSHEGRRLVTCESRDRSQPARRWLVEAATPAAGDRDAGGPPCHRLLVHLAESAAPGGLAFEAPRPSSFDDWLTGAGFPSQLGPQLEDAVDRRYALSCRDHTDAFRLVNGGGDGVAGVDVDLYGEHAVVALRSDLALEREDLILDAVLALGVTGVYLKRRPKKASTLIDTRRDEVAPTGAVRGRDADPCFLIHEGGLPFVVRLGDGLSTGIFLDQRDARSWLTRHAEGKRVLNLFCYHAAFTVAAIAGGARGTVSVDSARPALARAAENLARLTAVGSRHELVRADAIRYLEGAARRGEKFDLIVVDPPSFATTGRGRRQRVFRASRDYPRLAALALTLLSPGGRLLACTNHRGIVPTTFQKMLRRAAREAKVEIVSMSPFSDPSDFPPPPDAPSHLKRFVLKVAP